MRRKALVLSAFPAPYRIRVFELMSKQYDLDVFFGAGSNESRHADFYGKADVLPFTVLGNSEGDAKFKEALKKIRSYDFVMAYDYNQKCAFQAIVLCKLFHIPYFVNIDGAILRKHPIKDAGKRFLLCSAAGGFSSGKSATDYLTYYGIAPEKIHTHCFTSLNAQDILTQTVTDKPERKKALGLPQRKTVIAVGQFVPRKGFDVLLRAWKPLDEVYQLLLIGGGDDGQLYADILREENLHNVIIHDFVPKEELTEYYRASDLFVLPTREDIWGLVINEAMANGLPVITTDNCVAGVELIQSGVNGYLVPVENTALLAQRMEEILGSDSLSSAMGEANLRRMQGCTLEKIAEAHCIAIEKTLG